MKAKSIPIYRGDLNLIKQVCPSAEIVFRVCRVVEGPDSDIAFPLDYVQYDQSRFQRRYLKQLIIEIVEAFLLDTVDKLRLFGIAKRFIFYL